MGYDRKKDKMLIYPLNLSKRLNFYTYYTKVYILYTFLNSCKFFKDLRHSKTVKYLF